MHSSGAEVTSFERVISREHVLHTEVPLNRVRLFDDARNVVRRGCTGSSGVNAAPAEPPVSPPFFKKVRAADCGLPRSIDVLGGGELRGKSEQSEVVEQDVVRHSEPGAD